MRAARGLGLGAQLIPHQGVHGAVTERKVMLLGQVLLNRAITRKTLRLLESGLSLLQHRCGHPTDFARSFVDRQQRLQAPGFVECQPCTDGVTMDGQELSQR